MGIFSSDEFGYFEWASENDRANQLEEENKKLRKIIKRIKKTAKDNIHKYKRNSLLNGYQEIITILEEEECNSL